MDGSVVINHFIFELLIFGAFYEAIIEKFEFFENAEILLKKIENSSLIQKL